MHSMSLSGSSKPASSAGFHSFVVIVVEEKAKDVVEISVDDSVTNKEAGHGSFHFYI